MYNAWNFLLPEEIPLLVSKFKIDEVWAGKRVEKLYFLVLMESSKLHAGESRYIKRITPRITNGQHVSVIRIHQDFSSNSQIQKLVTIKNWPLTKFIDGKLDYVR